ncbi:MAG: hypothetical protein JW959_13095 [Pirellulales bacterium]|nr:hypothetical protein [Pirellulales bacterium]
MIESTTHATDYARLTPPAARIVLCAIAIASLLGAFLTLTPLQSDNLNPKRKAESDVSLYAAEAERIRNGEDYYSAAAAELTKRGYPTRSVFNWRTPLPTWLVGKMPAFEWGKALLCGMAVVLMLMAFEALSREERSLKPLACALLLSGPLLPVFLDNLFVMPVLWAGVLIAMSICAYGLHRPWLGVALGLASLACRELALPYCLLAAAIAWRCKKRGELAGWLIGIAVWSALFALHWWRVGGLIPPDARSHPHGWLQFGGAGFVVSTAQMNAYLLLLPQWITALYLAAALVGLAGWSSPLGIRVGLCVCLYLAAFAAVGQSFNQYWGALIAPLLCFGLVRLPASIRDLWRAASFLPSPACEGRAGS